MMRARRFHHPGDVRLDDVPPPPQPSSGEVLVAPVLTGVCGTDVRFYRSGGLQRAPQILGHECAAQVVSTGPGVRQLQPGQRVVVIPQEPCSSCPTCHRGHPERCPHRRTVGIRHTWGALADLILLRESQVVPLPDDLTWQQAAMTEPTSVALNAVSRGALRPGQSVTVIGGGAIGALAALVINAAGECAVQVRETSASRTRKLAELGVDVVAPGTIADADSGFDVAIDCAGNQESLATAIASTRIGGTVVLAAAAPHPVEVDVRTAMHKGLVVRTAIAYPLAAWWWRRTLRLIGEGIDVTRLAEHVVPLTAAADELARLAEHPGDSLKTLVRISETEERRAQPGQEVGAALVAEGRMSP